MRVQQSPMSKLDLTATAGLQKLQLNQVQKALRNMVRQHVVYAEMDRHKGQAHEDSMHLRGHAESLDAQS